MPDPIEALLRPLPIPNRVKAVAWDVFQQSASPDDLAAKLRDLPIPQEAKAALWNLKANAGGQVPAQEPGAPPSDPMSAVDRLLSFLPMAGGAAGGIIGGIGGTVGGMGVGGIPGAIGGAALGGSAGEALRQLANRVRWEEAPDTAGEAARDIGFQGVVQGASEGVGGVVTKGAAKGAQAVYRGYLKPSLAAKKIAKAGPVVRTAMNEGIPISRTGATLDETGKIAGKAGRVISEMHDEVRAAVREAPGKVDLKRIADRVRRVARQRYFKPGSDPSDYQAALSVADRIDQHKSLGIPPGMVPSRIRVSVSQANEVKQALQESARSSYGVPNAGAKEVAEKAGARKLRVAIEANTGGRRGVVGRLNARESKLIDAAQAIAHAVEREANQYTLSGTKSLLSGTLGAGTYAAGAAAPLAAAGALAARTALHPAVASRAALLANRLSKELGIGAASATRLAAYVLAESDGGNDE